MRCRGGETGADLRARRQDDRLPKGAKQMQIRSRMSMSADGNVTTPDGWPAQLADPAFVSGESHGIREFLEGCEAALMGRTTFEPALTADRWPWPNLNVFCLLHSVRPAPPTTWSATATQRGCWRGFGRRTRAETSTSSAALARSRPTAPWERSTSSSWSCCRCCWEAGCS